MGDDGFYERNGEEIGFVISVMSGEQDRIDIAQAAAQQLQEIGINCTVDIPAQMDWGGQMACLIGWEARLMQMTIPIRFLVQIRGLIIPVIPMKKWMNI